MSSKGAAKASHCKPDASVSDDIDKDHGIMDADAFREKVKLIPADAKILVYKIPAANGNGMRTVAYTQRKDSDREVAICAERFQKSLKGRLTFDNI